MLLISLSLAEAHTGSPYAKKIAKYRDIKINNKV
jgi:hypothetical protein